MTKKIGLTLGGGATKGFIHLGVLKYLEEHGYEITCIAGTSMGSIVGSMIAAGMGYKELYTHAKYLNYTKLIDIDLKTGLIKGDKIIHKLASILGDIQFEDLLLPINIIATNIDSGKEKIFSSGSILAAIRASMSLPGIFSLAKLAKDDTHERYIDGGVVNSLPVSHTHAHEIVAVSCMGLASFQRYSKKKIMGVDIDTSWFTLTKRVLMRSHYIMMARNEDREIAQHPKVHLIRPELEHISSFDLNVLEDAIQIGYNEAKYVLEEAHKITKE